MSATTPSGRGHAGPATVYLEGAGPGDPALPPVTAQPLPHQCDSAVAYTPTTLPTKREGYRLEVWPSTNILTEITARP